MGLWFLIFSHTLKCCKTLKFGARYAIYLIYCYIRIYVLGFYEIAHLIKKQSFFHRGMRKAMFNYLQHKDLRWVTKNH
jgi:hypothetical protein